VHTRRTGDAAASPDRGAHLAPREPADQHGRVRNWLLTASWWALSLVSVFLLVLIAAHLLMARHLTRRAELLADPAD
jgi:hypothetical protein